MKLSDGERLIVVMLAEVMQTMELTHEVDPALIKALACGGDDWAIKYKYPSIFADETPTQAEVSETTDILWMWGILESSLARLSGTDAAEAKGWHGTQFEGFDGNNDTHYGIASTMINNLDKFESFKNRGLNSHSQASLPRYQAMYKKFYEYVRSGDAAPLSFDALQKIFN